MTFAYILEYKVRESNTKAFKVAYGLKGGWVQLFQRDPANIRTELSAVSSDLEHFLAIAYWTTRQADFAFRKRFQAEFDAIDNRHAQDTIEERHLGDFDLAD
ncbi:MAG: hypothetical protein WBR29_08755 [Gammaproteobacteria bacterium]